MSILWLFSSIKLSGLKSLESAAPSKPLVMFEI